MIPGTAIST